MARSKRTDAIRSLTKRRRRWGAALAASTLVGVLVDPGPSIAAVIPAPTNQAVCGHLNAGKPVITSFTRTPGSVNVLHGPKPVTFTVKATDVSPIGEVQMYLGEPGHGTDLYVPFHRVHGTNKNGTWVAIWTVPRGTHPGSWRIESLFMNDSGGGAVTYANPHQTPELPWPSGWPRSVKVTSTWDRQGPKLVKSSFTPTVVNTTSKPQTVRVTAHVHDAVSGVAQVEVMAGSKSKFGGAAQGLSLTKHGGTSNDAVFTGQLVIPTWAGAGKHLWFLDFDMQDRVGNESFTDAKGSLTVTSRSDTHPPVIKSASFSPSSVDATNGDKHVTLTVHATDSQSGVGEVFADVSGPSGEDLELNLTRTAGTAENGTWQTRLIMPRCGDPGSFVLQELNFSDVAGHSVDLAPNQLKAKHLAASLTVKSLDWTPPSVSYRSLVPHAGPLVLTFSEPVYWKDGTVNSTFLGLPAGAWTCKSPAAVSVACDGASLVKTASFQPTAGFTVGQYYEATSFQNIYDQYYNGPAKLDVSFEAS